MKTSIGNWFKVKHYPEDQIFELQMHKNTMWLKNLKLDFFVLFDENVVSPIALEDNIGILLDLGFSYLLGKNDGDMTKDLNGKIDLDYVKRQIQVKSHYEGYDFYRPLRNVKYVHQLQNVISSLEMEHVD